MTLTMTYRTSFTSVRAKTSSPRGKTTKTRRARTEPRRIEVEFEFNDANQESALDRTWRKEKKSKSTVNNATHNTETTSAPTASRRTGRPHHARSVAWSYPADRSVLVQSAKRSVTSAPAEETRPS